MNQSYDILVTESKELEYILSKECLDFVAELNQIQSNIGKENYNKGKFKEASDIFYSISTSEKFEEFLTLPLYKLLT